MRFVFSAAVGGFVLLLAACAAKPDTSIKRPPSWPAPKVEVDGRCLPFYVKVRDRFAERAAGLERLPVAESLFEELSRYSTRTGGGTLAGVQPWLNTIELRLLDNRSLVAVARDQSGARSAQLTFDSSVVSCRSGGVVLERGQFAAIDGEQQPVRQRLVIYPADDGELLVQHRAVQFSGRLRVFDGGAEVEEWHRYIAVR